MADEITALTLLCCFRSWQGYCPRDTVLEEEADINIEETLTPQTGGAHAQIEESGGSGLLSNPTTSPARPTNLNHIQANVPAATAAFRARGTDDELQVVCPTRSTIHNDPLDVQVEGVAEPLDGHRGVAAAQCGRRVIVQPCRPMACVSFGDDANVSPAE